VIENTLGFWGYYWVFRESSSFSHGVITEFLWKLGDAKEEFPSKFLKMNSPESLNVGGVSPPCPLPSTKPYLPEAVLVSHPELAAEPGCNVCTFAPGEMIFTEGSPADSAYVIESGYVEVFVGPEAEAIQLNILGPGDIFGEMGIIDASPRSASTKAISHCRCIVVAASQIAERIASATPMVRLLMSMALHRTRTQNSFLKTVGGAPRKSLYNQLESDPSYLKSQQYQQILTNIKLESELQNSIKNNELRLYYQPLVDLAQNSIVGFESLLRWRSPSRGMVSPQQFIPLAEETSLILPISTWLLERACIDLRRFQNQMQRVGLASQNFFVSVNISVKQFQEPDFLGQLLNLTRQYGIKPKQLKLEVTERVFLDDLAAINAIKQCRAAGFEVALDDFGIGYSSFNYLECCEIDSLKIDKSFTQKLCSSSRAQVLIKTIVDMAKQLGFPAVVEGIETEEQRQIVQNLGCEIGQGYLFSQPVPFRHAISLLMNGG
jgi:EAL domain-containing protein (putative c-di-GMP-specific phosphodiesterase class I)/CRP-like cAMP-binding protein